VDAGVVLAQDAARAVDGVRRADGVDERVDVAVRLAPDLLAQRQVARDRVGVAELVAPPVAGLLAEPARRGDHLLDQRLGDALVVAGHVRDVRAERLHRDALLVAERVGEDDLEVVAQGRADIGE
jgi:hypothetical protein